MFLWKTPSSLEIWPYEGVYDGNNNLWFNINGSLMIFDQLTGEQICSRLGTNRNDLESYSLIDYWDPNIVCCYIKLPLSSNIQNRNCKIYFRYFYGIIKNECPYRKSYVGLGNYFVDRKSVV